MGPGPLCVGSGPLTTGSQDSETKNTQALIKARRESGAATCPDHTTYASDVSQRVEPDVGPLGRATSAFIVDKARHLSIPLAGDVPPRHLMSHVDEDITSIHTMNGPITRSRARQLNLQVHSTLVNCVSELTLGAMDVLMIRYLGEDQQGLGKGQVVEEEQQGRPQHEGDQVRVGCDSISGSRTSLH
jgi:hypothetical protein